MPSSNSVDVTKYVDFNYRGYQYSESESQKYPFLLKSTEAIKNVINMHLMSNKGDYGRDLSKGGPLLFILGKQMNEATQKDIENKIKDALSAYSNIIVNSVVATMDTAEKRWYVKITFSDSYNKFTDTINLSINEG